MVDYNAMNPQIEYFICRHCTPSWIIADAYTTFIDLTYIYKGRSFYSVNNIEYEVNQGDLLCIPQGSRRSAVTYPINPMVSYTANFQLYDLHGKDIDLPFPLLTRIDEHEDLFSWYNELTIEWLKGNPGYGMKARALLLMILNHYFKILYYKKPTIIDLRIQKAVDYILDNLTRQIDVEELAVMAGLTTGYFGTLFMKYMGYPVKEYINRMKINNAENILLSGEFSVHEAAYKSGFEDIFYFSKVFKSIKGYSPSKVLKK
jgi:AraC family L-rhamnose operon regulatory protein RhaS